jgi:sulfonate transport system permease protein
MIGQIRFLTFCVFSLISLELVMRSSGVSPAVFSYPSDVVQVLPEFLPGGEHSSSALSTLSRTILAFIISMILGVTLGITLYFIPFLNKELEAAVDFLRSIPGTALVPVFFVTLGIGEASKIGAAVFGGALLMCVSTLVGLKSIGEERQHCILSQYPNLRIKPITFYLLEVLPSIFVGFRTTISLCLVLVVVSEMFMGADGGIGAIIMDSRYGGQIETLYCAIFFSGCLGYLLNWLIGLLIFQLTNLYPRFI